MRQVELADHDLNIDTEIVLAAEHFHHAPTWVLGCGGPMRDLHIDHNSFQIRQIARASSFLADHSMLTAALGRFGWSLHPRWNHNLLGYVAVDGGRVVVASPIVKCPHDCWVSPVKWADDAPFHPSIRTHNRNLGQHLIAMHGIANRRRWNGYIAHDC